MIPKFLAVRMTDREDMVQSVHRAGIVVLRILVLWVVVIISAPTNPMVPGVIAEVCVVQHIVMRTVTPVPRGLLEMDV
jgi:hypothetical protein